jgi:hypothetical protein
MVGLARGVVRRRTASTSTVAPVEEAEDLAVKAAKAAVKAGGDTTARPETLASLDREVDHLRERFEHAESERHAGDARSARHAETEKTR